MDAIFTLNEIDAVAKHFWKSCKKHKVWAFYASMGTGKTTFIHHLCESILQVSNNTSSPTFSIINEYESPIAGTIFHMDWYRLKDEEEAINAGVEDALFSGNYCLLEWPEKAQHILPENTLHIHIETLDTNTRRIFIPEE